MRKQRVYKAKLYWKPRAKKLSVRSVRGKPTEKTSPAAAYRALLSRRSGLFLFFIMDNIHKWWSDPKINELITHNHERRKRRQVNYSTAVNNNVTLFLQNKAVLRIQFSSSAIYQYRHMLILGRSKMLQCSNAVAEKWRHLLRSLNQLAMRVDQLYWLTRRESWSCTKSRTARRSDIDKRLLMMTGELSPSLLRVIKI